MKRHRLYWIAWAGLLLGWVGYALAGGPVSRIMAVRFGNVLLRLGRDKFSDAAWFVECRLGEALWLATLVMLWIAAHWVLGRLIRARIQRERWVAQGLAGFVFLNLWIGAAMNTALFWGALLLGAGFQNLEQFHFKRILLEENPAHSRAVLMGSSQTRAEINAERLNNLLGTNLWTTELHFPGCHGYDLLLLERRIRRSDPRWVVCYVTEGYFYLSSEGETPPNFFGLVDLADGWRRGALRYLSRDEIFSGLLGDVLPLFRCREALAQRLFGSATVDLKQVQYNTSLQVDLQARAGEAASGFRLSPESEFQKKAFEEFVARCQQAHRRVVLLAGSYNPILARKINPAVRADLLAFLEELKSRYPNVVLIPESELPEQNPADYEDLSHVNADMRDRFTLYLAGRLSPLLDTRESAP